MAGRLCNIAEALTVRMRVERVTGALLAQLSLDIDWEEESAYTWVFARCVRAIASALYKATYR